MGFTKLDEGILQSSIMAESCATFKVWIALLASCGSDGIARVSSVFLASTCHLPLKSIDHSLEILSLPDTRSRSLIEEGRRIIRVDGGYFIVNYEKYRTFTYSDHPESVRKREYRKRIKEGDALGHVPFCPGHSASASVFNSSLSSLDNKNLKKGLETNIEEIKSLWNGFAAKHGLAEIEGIEKETMRHSHLLARMKKESFDFRRLLDIINSSPFLLGQTQGKKAQPFFVTFDWIICPSNYQKIIEGNYLDRKYSTLAAWIAEMEEKQSGNKL